MVGILREIDCKDCDLFDLFLFSDKWELVKYVACDIAIFRKIKD
jgi:hypothetical protein